MSTLVVTTGPKPRISTTTWPTPRTVVVHCARWMQHIAARGNWRRGRHVVTRIDTGIPGAFDYGNKAVGGVVVRPARRPRGKAQADDVKALHGGDRHRGCAAARARCPRPSSCRRVEQSRSRPSSSAARLISAVLGLEPVSLQSAETEDPKRIVPVRRSKLVSCSPIANSSELSFFLSFYSALGRKASAALRLSETIASALSDEALITKPLSAYRQDCSGLAR
jgi:hypothetical protein